MPTKKLFLFSGDNCNIFLRDNVRKQTNGKTLLGQERRLFIPSLMRNKNNADTFKFLGKVVQFLCDKYQPQQLPSSTSKILKRALKY